MESSEKRWEFCYVSGCIIACDPGIQNLSHYPKQYKRSEMRVGMNLCAHNEHLPVVTLKAMGENFIEVQFFGGIHKILTGQSKYTPRKGLDYAYSEATISISDESMSK